MPGGKTHRIRPRQSIKPGMAGSSMASIYPVQSRPQHDHNNDHNRYNDNTTHSLSPLSPPPVVCMWGTTYPPHTTDRKGRIIAWNQSELLLIEVKARSPSGLSNALSLFRANVRTMTHVPDYASMLCYVWLNGHWSAYKWGDNGTKQVEPVVSGER